MKEMQNELFEERDIRRRRKLTPSPQKYDNSFLENFSSIDESESFDTDQIMHSPSLHSSMKQDEYFVAAIPYSKKITTKPIKESIISNNLGISNEPAFSMSRYLFLLNP